MRRMVTLCVVALAAMMSFAAGCGEKGNTESSPSAASKGTNLKNDVTVGERGRGDPPPAVPRKVVGGANAGCELPVEFALAASWKAEQPERKPSVTLNDFTLLCEIDARSAGHRGSMRVWSGGDPGPGADTREALETFLELRDRKVDQVRFRPFDTDSISGSRASYVATSPSTSRREAAFAVPAEGEIVVITLSGADTQEYLDMLPAFVLAMTTIKATS